MSEPVLVPFGGGEAVGDSSDRRVEILSEHETLHATWSRFGPHRDGANLHVHRLHTDLVYVLEGELTVALGVEDERVVVPAGTLARVPPLFVHGFRSAGDAELRYVNFHAPGVGFADYLRALRDGRTVSFDQHPGAAHVRLSRRSLCALPQRPHAELRLRRVPPRPQRGAPTTTWRRCGPRSIRCPPRQGDTVRA